MPRLCPVCNTELSDGVEVCPSCGFKLKGQTASFAPITDAQAFEEAQARSGASSSVSVFLRIIRGPQIPKSYPITSDITVIGRSPNCDIFLNDMTVSRLHARLLKINGSYIIEDNRSYNGVWVNNANCITRKLQNGDLIQIGSFCLVFEME